MQRNQDLESIHACEKLKIDRAIFTSLPSFDDRVKAVIYYYIKNELTDIAHKIAAADIYVGQLSAIYDEVFKISDNAFQYLLSSSYLKTHASAEARESYYGPHSLGLREMYLDCKPIKIGEKKAGIEPGMMAIDEKDIFILFYLSMPKAAERRYFLFTLLYKLKSEGVEINIDTIIKVIAEHLKNNLPNYLFKLTFEDIISGKYVEPEAAGIVRTSTVQKYAELGGGLFRPLVESIATRVVQRAKRCTFKEKNFEATLEVLTNDLAALLGLKTQQQVLCRDNYKNGLLKLLLKGLWVSNAQTLPLGGNRKEGELQTNGNYCVKPVKWKRENIEALADNSINIARYYIFFILFGDYDTIGSKGQNKLFIPADDPHAQLRDFLGIDFGHSFAKNIIGKLSKRDFSFSDSKFKNFDIFRDAPRSAFMEGVLPLAILAGEKIPPLVMESYGFKTTLNAGDDEKLFEDYHQMFIRLGKSFPDTEIGNRNRSCCRFIVEKILATKEKEIHSRNQIVKHYAHYLQLTRFEVDLLENIEKLFAGPTHTSLRSTDGTVLLNHLRIVPDESSLETFLQIEFIETKDTPTSRQFDFTFSSAAEAYKSLLILQSWRKDARYLEVKQNEKKIIFKYGKDRINDIYDLFNENKIKRCFHPQDYALYAHYKREEKLDFLLRELGIIFHTDFSCMLNTEDSYTIELDQSELLNLLKPKFKDEGITFEILENKDCPEKGKCTIQFKINKFIKVLDIFEECYVEQQVCELVRLRFYLEKILRSYSAKRRNSWTPNLKFNSEEILDQMVSPRTSTIIKSMLTTYIDPRMQLSSGVLAHLHKELENIKKHPDVDVTAIKMAKEIIENLLRPKEAVSTSSSPLRFRATTC